MPHVCLSVYFYFHFFPLCSFMFLYWTVSILLCRTTVYRNTLSHCFHFALLRWHDMDNAFSIYGFIPGWFLCSRFIFGMTLRLLLPLILFFPHHLLPLLHFFPDYRPLFRRPIQSTYTTLLHPTPMDSFSPTPFPFVSCFVLCRSSEWLLKIFDNVWTEERYVRKYIHTSILFTQLSTYV